MIQNERIERFDQAIKLEKNISRGGMVLIYDSRYAKFRGKLHTRWIGPFKVEEIFRNGSLKLKTLEGDFFNTYTNGSRVIFYYLILEAIWNDE